MRSSGCSAGLATIASLLVACGGGPAAEPDRAIGSGDGPVATPDGGPRNDRSAPADSGPAACVPACKTNQICVNATCTDLPSQCPCPVESYCDLSTNKCVAGCAQDDHCLAGRYCDGQRHCQNGCRTSSCGPSEVCNTTSRACDCKTGFHRCSGSCVAEGLSSCGPSCTVCPTDTSGTASCTSSGCQLACKNGYKMCGTACAACPTGATALSCSGSKCVASGCSSGSHVCSGSCVVEDLKSCGASCAACSDTTQGACSSSACYGVVDFGYFPKATTCTARCASLGKTCGNTCDVHYTRPSGGTSYHQAAGGLYTQQAAFEPWGFLSCTDTMPTSDPTSIRCCCTEQLTGAPKPGCTKNTDCGSTEFCWAAKQECYPTTDSRCPPGYTYKGQCSSGTQWCSHSGLPTGTTFPFEQACPAGTTQRGSFYCSGETKVCVPD